MELVKCRVIGQQYVGDPIQTGALFPIAGTEHVALCTDAKLLFNDLDVSLKSFLGLTTIQNIQKIGFHFFACFAVPSSEIKN